MLASWPFGKRRRVAASANVVTGAERLHGRNLSQERLSAPVERTRSAATWRDDAESTGDGFTLATASGAKLTLVMLMFLEAPTPDVLAALMRDADARYVARGYAISGTQRAFDPARCVFLYRLE